LHRNAGKYGSRRDAMSNTIAISFNSMNASEILAAFVTHVDDEENGHDFTHLDTGRRFSVPFLSEQMERIDSSYVRCGRTEEC
jgi:hypothetical protein